MEIFVCKDYDDVSKKATSMVVEQLKEKPASTLGLATGSSPIGLYKGLIEQFKDGNISFKNVKSFNLDEYCGISTDHPQSYYTFMHNNLFNHVDIEEKNVNIPKIIEDNLDKSCEVYNEALRNNKIDLQILGIGANGHIGFNEPKTSFKQETFIANLTEKTRKDNMRFFNGIDEVPTKAITMGISNILNAKKIILIATGEGKAQAVKDMVSGPISEDCPASSLRLHPNVSIIVDETAAKLL